MNFQSEYRSVQHTAIKGPYIYIPVWFTSPKRHILQYGFVFVFQIGSPGWSEQPAAASQVLQLKACTALLFHITLKVDPSWDQVPWHMPGSPALERKNDCRFKAGPIYRVRSELEGPTSDTFSWKRTEQKTVYEIPGLKRPTSLRLIWAKYITRYTSKLRTWVWGEARTEHGKQAGSALQESPGTQSAKAISLCCLKHQAVLNGVSLYWVRWKAARWYCSQTLGMCQPLPHPCIHSFFKSCQDTRKGGQPHKRWTAEQPLQPSSKSAGGKEIRKTKTAT